MFNTLSGRFLLLTCVFVLLAEVLILVPSVARFREDYLMARLERAQIASLSLLADDMLTPELEAELLRNAEVYNVVLRRDARRELVLSSPVPAPVSATFDLRRTGPWERIRDALDCLFSPEMTVIRVIGEPVLEGGLAIEITLPGAPLRAAMLAYGGRVFALSLIISVIAAALLYLAVRRLMVRPIAGVVRAMSRFAAAPEDARRVVEPGARVAEIRAAEEALHDMQTELAQALKQKQRLAQVGASVARISHDLRNILTTAQLFADRMEMSDDPAVQRAAPKLIRSIDRAVNLCESTLSFGRAEEPAPRLTMVPLAEVVGEVLESERLAAGPAEITFNADLPAGYTLRADPEQLDRILRNLVRNARQAITASGAPGIIRIRAEESETEWQLFVTDTGPGLPQKAQDLLFQPFAATGRKGGTGLGLAIAADLTRGHNGRLELLHTDPNGTTFRVSLPKGFDIIPDGGGRSP
ncbi:MAG: sensor histidine kinase [Rhodobacterales bacterium]|nr:MAG: sensor histidine kinase [Rhodobacterales bacterium]